MTACFSSFIQSLGFSLFCGCSIYFIGAVFFLS